MEALYAVACSARCLCAQVLQPLITTTTTTTTATDAATAAVMHLAASVLAEERKEGKTQLHYKTEHQQLLSAVHRSTAVGTLEEGGVPAAAWRLQSSPVQLRSNSVLEQCAALRRDMAACMSATGGATAASAASFVLIGGAASLEVLAAKSRLLACLPLSLSLSLSQHHSSPNSDLKDLAALTGAVGTAPGVSAGLYAWYVCACVRMSLFLSHTHSLTHSLTHSQVQTPHPAGMCVQRGVPSGLQRSRPHYH